MPSRRAHGLLATLLLALLSGGCGEHRAPDPATAQRQQLVRAAREALRGYNAPAARPGVYAGHTSAGQRVRLRLSARRGVTFSIALACAGRRFRAFPNQAPRLRLDDRFSYRERGRSYRLEVAGIVGPGRASGRVSLVAHLTRGRPCRTRVSWRASSA
jgi:hypothetical protein